MDIKVSLPKPENITGKEIKSFLRQMELSLHHLEKAVEQMDTDGLLTENTYILFHFPHLERQWTKDNDNAKVHVDENAEEMQEVELEIRTV